MTYKLVRREVVKGFNELNHFTALLKSTNYEEDYVSQMCSGDSYQHQQHNCLILQNVMTFLINYNAKL